LNIKPITVSFAPAWDITCWADGVDWGQHPTLTRQTTVPAGKALNVSRAMAWMGQPNTAMGLWGKADAEWMRQELAELQNTVDLRFTLADGRTRQNVTIIDTRNRREMHLRGISQLATPTALAQLDSDLKATVRKNSSVAFCGAMPEDDRLAMCITIIQNACKAGAAVAIDTSGDAIKKAVALGGLDVIKPNLDELCELLGKTVPDEPRAITAAARTLCDRVRIVLVSRGKNGAIAVMQQQAFCCAAADERPAVNTVGCGDYLLAGFLAADTDDIAGRLALAVKAAAARAYGLTETHTWLDVQRQIDVNIEAITV